MSNVDFGTKLEIITDYYGAGTIWDRMDISGLNTDQINAMYNSLPGSSFTIDRTPSGLNLGRNYNNPFELPVVPGTDFDSNISGGSYGGGNTFTGNVPCNIVTDPTTGLPVRQTAGPTTSGGLSLPAIADRISLAVAGVNIGAKLGLKIDEALYKINPSWWNEHLPGMNPETWNTLVGQSAIGDFFLRVLFGITGNNMTGYISDDMLAYYYQMLRDVGAWDKSEAYSASIQDTTGLSDVVINNQPYPCVKTSSVIYTGAYNSGIKPNIGPGFTLVNATSDVYTIAFSDRTLVACSKESFGYFHNYWNEYGQYSNSGTASRVTINGKTLYKTTLTTLLENSAVNVPYIDSSLRLYEGSISYIVVYGKLEEPSGGVDGITQPSTETQYPPTNITGSTPQQVKQQLQEQYPDLFTDAVTEKTLQDDGTVTETTLIPIPWTTTGLDDEQATTGDGKGQTDTQVDPTTGEQILPTTPQDEPTQPPDTGDGSTPVPALPSGSASSLWAVYNPSQSELNSFGAWLWSSDFVEQLKKLFADPMQAIIGVHKVFASPHTGGVQTIKCGYLDSGVSSAIVTSQYTTVDCGSASLREYFGNVFDYDPFTKVSIFLPFIGIVPLNTADVMRSTVSVKYKVDVITGACLAEVSISRDGSGGILYTYGGSAIVTYPVSSGSYVGAVQAALSTAIGIGSAIATGGASLGASAGMVLGGLSHAKTQVQHSGQFSGSSGAMGGKKPYLIVSRPQTRTPSKIGEYKGIPSNAIHKLSSCNGYVKVEEVHITSKSAYDNELQEIESLLKSGVII